MISDIGNRLKDLRLSNNLSQTEFGNIAGLHNSTIGRIEKGKFIPTADAILSWADYFSLTCDDLIRGDSAQMQNTDQNDRKILELYNSLNSYDQIEIRELMEFKLQRKDTEKRETLSQKSFQLT